MFSIGDRVLFKSIDLIEMEGSTTIRNGMPIYAVGEMLPLYGDGVSYPIISSDPCDVLVLIDKTHSFWVQKDDILLDRTVGDVICEGEDVILKRDTTNFYAGEIAKVVAVDYVDMTATLLLDARGEIVPLEHLTPARGIRREQPSRNTLYDVDDEIVLISDTEQFLRVVRNYDRTLIGLYGEVLRVGRPAYDGCRFIVAYDKAGEMYSVPVSVVQGKKPDGYIAPEARFYTCERCGSYYIVSKNDNIEPEDFCLCEECRKREYITPYHRYSPPLHFWKTEGDDDLYLGAEIEIDYGGESNDTAAMIVRDMNPSGKWFMYCSHDGSLSDGIEMITSPATLNYHLSMKDKYESLFKKLAKMGYRSHNTPTCGLHVHFSRDFFADNEEENVCKLLYLVEKFWDDLIVFSRRDYRSVERYARKINCDAKRFFESWDKTGMHDGHYYAVNITNQNTIELRMFRGTINVTTYLATLAFVDAIVRTAKRCSAEELQAISFEEILPDCAKEYYQSRKLISKFDAEDGNVSA